MLYECKRIMPNTYKQILLRRYKLILLIAYFHIDIKEMRHCAPGGRLPVFLLFSHCQIAPWANDIANPAIARVSIRHHLIASSDVLFCDQGRRSCLR